MCAETGDDVVLDRCIVPIHGGSRRILRQRRVQRWSYQVVTLTEYVCFLVSRWLLWTIWGGFPYAEAMVQSCDDNETC